MDRESRSPFEKREDVRRSRFLTSLLVPLALGPLVVRWATLTALSPGPAWLGRVTAVVLNLSAVIPWLSLVLVPVGALGTGKCLLDRRPAGLTFRWAALSLGALLCLELGEEARAVHHTRTVAVGTVARHAVPLVDAIEAFSDRYQRRPSHLGELVPRFLPRIPSTGLAGYRQFQYRSRMGDYILSVPTPSGPLDTSEIGYRPQVVRHPSAFPESEPGSWTFLE